MHRSHHSGEPRGAHPPATTGRLIRWARWYDTSVSLMLLGRRTQLRRATVELAQLQPGESVLEVGCGTGDVALAAWKRTGSTGNVCGIDPAPEMIARGRPSPSRSA
jgi:ubiquinone/menaquinone biosynthesis C-methylase UbiE